MTSEDRVVGSAADGNSSGDDLDVRVARELIDKARADGVSLVGPNGLLRQVTKTVLESALNAELDDHLGYAKGDVAGKFGGNERNGSSSKTVRTDVGDVRIDVPRDRQGTFTPQIVPKYARRVEGFDDAVISLYAKGLTTGEIQAHLADIYDARVSRELISKITDKVVDDLNSWQARPLDRVYPVVLIDAIHVKIRDGAVANRPIYIAVGITLAGERDVLGMWVGTGGEGAKGWLNHLSDLKNRGVEDVLIVACDGLKGLPEAIAALWPQAEVQLCVVHLVRASLRYASKKYWSAITKRLKLIYTAPTAEAAEVEFVEFCAEWEERYPAMVRLWRNSWEQFTPFLAHPPELRRLVYTTNAIESLNARFRQATRRRGHFPNDQAALKVLYLVINNPLKNRSNITGKVVGWKQALNALAMHYGDRLDVQQ
ncbi:IS256 family transposase [Amycolatopsis cihanbeyliensis]|uniref:Mutator family transposase n=1 Tax=Amycolatopsis cihanbeyliensis TaxID=1128664 RepID=A0A542CTC4_AMYCI|nr:IS256 family transposase [Amycolatopsis cihanbeyliensis]TQI94072.1 transposase-like protein [Amycolatopsis cihanbeyliensis]TQJ01327.1 transposase-like protein [Amycolatopsis cihanbeyliensis]TQJ01669.1 transposase-like protein [Amycolatopsis cihanbeyliensis]